MNIYTKTGDAGDTGLLGGNRVSKDHMRIEAYGTLDELNAWLGLIADVFPNQFESDFVRGLQNDVFLLGSHLAAENEKGKSYLNPIRAELLQELESEIDRMTASLPPLRNFILPGGHVVVSQVHIARTVCRRAERMVVRLHHADQVDPLIIQILNRMSDYLFTLARAASVFTKTEEKPWISRV
ncbi:MAG: cob(I)yrinic acid a,c-diamide adenosyltransferase [Flavobacteriales bacterium]|nr:MAG: cob(I)yrinic acid a,c-diamide adenosyltransferase [Flavobacteriales bacterium]